MIGNRVTVVVAGSDMVSLLGDFYALSSYRYDALRRRSSYETSTLNNAYTTGMNYKHLPHPLTGQCIQTATSPIFEMLTVLEVLYFDQPQIRDIGGHIASVKIGIAFLCICVGNSGEKKYGSLVLA